MKIDYTCKLCGKDLAAELRPDQVCEEQWIETFRKMLVCNPSYDRREKFRTAERQIVEACTQLDRIAKMKMDDSMRFNLVKKYRVGLTSATRRYAESMADFRNLAEVMWHEDFVDQLVEVPERCGVILKRYREGLAGLPKADPVTAHAAYESASHYRPTAPDP